MLRNTIALAGLTLALMPGLARAHCQIPCGIYGDRMRIQMIEEHLRTVEKSMVTVANLSESGQTNGNQLVRWVSNKEEHAAQIQEIVTQYFMAQRIKVPSATKASSVAAYNRKLGLLHHLLVSAMKMKQSTNVSHVKKARELLAEFESAYFSKTDGGHAHEKK